MSLQINASRTVMSALVNHRCIQVSPFAIMYVAAVVSRIRAELAAFAAPIGWIRRTARGLRPVLLGFEVIIEPVLVFEPDVGAGAALELVFGFDVQSDKKNQAAMLLVWFWG